MVIQLSCRSLVGAAAVVGLALTALPAAAADYALMSGQQVVGGFGEYTTKNGDLFADLARRFDIGFPELVAANRGLDPWLPGVNREIRVPSAFVLPDAPQRGIVINLGQWRVFYFPPGGGQVMTFPVGLGTIGAKTPLGVTRIARKEPHPAWYPTPSIRKAEPDLPAVVPPGPNNPLGDYALHLGWPAYLLHGTNKPDGVGRNVSHGCIRLYPEDIQRLFASVSVGTPVRVVDQPATAGWYGNVLYLAVYPTKKQVFQLDTSEPVEYDPARGVDKVVRAAAGENAQIDWAAVREAAAQRTAMPVRIGTRSPAATVAATSAQGSPIPEVAVDTSPAWQAIDGSSGTPPGVSSETAEDGSEAGSPLPPGVTPETVQDPPPYIDPTDR